MIYIQVGALDNNPNSAGLRHNEYADAQGLNRVTRAVHFFETGKISQSQITIFQLVITYNSGC